ncbi:MAG: Sir2 family NAD-dependent protein deacetylase [Planctomycetota bacterium]
MVSWIQEATAVVWFTGAGISTESGLPDFRGPEGAWTNRDRGLPPPRPSKPLTEIRPNPAHSAIVEFERMGKCDFLISQNVDNLHLESGYPQEKLAELHGNKARLRCQDCQQTVAISKLVAMPRRRKTRRRRDLSHECPDCGGGLTRSIVNFGDFLPDRDLETAYDWADRADVLLVVGSSCYVTPAADIPRVAKQNDSKLVIINQGETGIDDLCDLRFSEPKAGELLPVLLARLRQATKSSLA